MNSAHASLLQWLQENCEHGVFEPKLLVSYELGGWNICLMKGRGMSSSFHQSGCGTSYEAACYDLLQQLKK
jgi:hypothetical protein